LSLPNFIIFKFFLLQFIHQLSKISGFTQFIPGFDTALDTYSDYPLQQFVRPAVKLAGVALAKEAGLINAGFANALTGSTLTNTAINAVSNYVSPRYTRSAYTPRTIARWTKTPTFNRSQSKYSRKMPLRRSRYGARRRRFGSRRMIRPRGRQVGRLQTAGRYRPARRAMLAPELKFWDVTQTSFLASGDQHWQILNPSLNLIVRGTGQSQRNGRKAVLKTLDLRFHMVRSHYSDDDGGTIPPVDPLTGGGRLTIYIVHDRQANGATGTPSGTVASGTGVVTLGPGAAPSANNFIQLATKDRYRIMKKLILTVPETPPIPATWDVAVPNNNTWHLPAYTGPTKSVHLNLKDLPIEYSGGDGAVTDDPEVITNVRSNNLFMMYQFESEALNAVQFSVVFHARMRFIG